MLLTHGALLVGAPYSTVRIVAIDADGRLTLLADGELHPAWDNTLALWGVRTVKAEPHDALSFLLDGSDVMTVMRLIRHPDQLADVWQDAQLDDEAFVTAVRILVGDEVAFCGCGAPEWTDDGRHCRGTFLCEGCYEADYFTCERCEDVHHDDESNDIGGLTWCDRCRDYAAYYCEYCDAYDTDGDGHDHEEPQCECDAPHRRFEFPANGDGFVRQNERLAVELPSGTISEEGLKAIHQHLYDSTLVSSTPRSIGAGTLWDIVDGLDPVWQTKRGNFTRRLSSALHAHGVKLGPSTLSAVGNIARQHTADSKDWLVEFTRDLNGSADEFAHGESCWWGSYSESRCCLKNWGGLAIRSYTDVDQESYYPSGRAWIQPLDADLKPTHDAAGAHAYVVYNGYGSLDGYTPARIVAHLTGLTYRRVTLHAGAQYVNNDSGYLIADAATCEDTDRVSYGVDAHSTYDAYTRATVAA